MRAIGQRIGAPAATVSQIEKGQRALKEPKIATWAAALEVRADDLNELWLLCQGWVRSDSGQPIFYAHPARESVAVGGADEGIAETLKTHPELEPIYQLAQQICAVMRRLLPNLEFEVQSGKRDDPIPTDLGEGEDQGQHVEFVPLPTLWVLWHDDRAPDPVAAVTIPLIEQQTPIARRRASTLAADDLQKLIYALSAVERERVRGYIDAIIEDRP